MLCVIAQIICLDHFLIDRNAIWLFNLFVLFLSVFMGLNKKQHLLYIYCGPIQFVCCLRHSQSFNYQNCFAPHLASPIHGTCHKFYALWPNWKHFLFCFRNTTQITASYLIFPMKFSTTSLSFFHSFLCCLSTHIGSGVDIIPAEEIWTCNIFLAA